MPVDYVASLHYFIFYRIQELLNELVRPLKISECKAHLIFVHNPALEPLVVSIVAASLLHNVVDGKMFKSGILRKNFGVCSLAYTWRTSNYDVWLIPHDICAEFMYGGQD